MDAWKGVRGDTALHTAARDGNVKLLGLLIEHGAQLDAVNQMNFTPLMSAMMKRQSDAALFLLEKGANTNYRDKVLGATPFGVAISYGVKPVVLILHKKYYLISTPSALQLRSGFITILKTHKNVG